MILPRLCVGAVIFTYFPLFVFAEYFTNPPSFVNQVKTQDLTTTFTFGQEVNITWFVPNLPYISLTLAHWDVDDIPFKAFLS